MTKKQGSASPPTADQPPAPLAGTVETAAVAHSARGVRVRALIDLPEYGGVAGADCEVPESALAELQAQTHVEPLAAPEA